MNYYVVDLNDPTDHGVEFVNYDDACDYIAEMKGKQAPGHETMRVIGGPERLRGDEGEGQDWYSSSMTSLFDVCDLVCASLPKRGV